MWKLCHVELPEVNEPVLVLATSGWMQVFRLQNGAWYPGGLPVCNSLAWMPLPERPIL